MSYISILNEASQPNGLPISANFVIPSNSASQQLLLVSGTAWASAPGIIGFQILIDGDLVGQTTILANQQGVHLTFPTVFILLNLTLQQNHTLTLQIIPGTYTVTDAGDVFNAALLA
jgi:hypothetical protein